MAWQVKRSRLQALASEDFRLPQPALPMVCTARTRRLVLGYMVRARSLASRAPVPMSVYTGLHLGAVPQAPALAMRAYGATPGAEWVFSRECLAPPMTRAPGFSLTQG